MVLEFQKEKQKQKMLIGVLVAIVLIVSLIVWYGYFQPEPSTKGSAGQGYFNGAKNINIDFETLESQKLKDMDPFVDTPAFSGEFGKPDLFKLTGKLTQESATSGAENVATGTEGNVLVP